MQQVLRDIARGPRGSRDLSYQEAYETAIAIYTGVATPAQVSAVLTALRVKGESDDEILGFTHALREHSTRLQPTDAHYRVDCAGPYDGRKHSAYLTLAVAMVLAAANVSVVVHGSQTLPPKFGVVLPDVLEVLSIPCASTADEAAALLASGFVCIHTEAFCEPLRTLRMIREQLGFRTVLNYAEKFLNLGGALALVAGVFHSSALEKAARCAQGLGYERVLIVQGVDGSEDVPMHRASAASLIHRGEVTAHRFDPFAYGLQDAPFHQKLTVQEHADAIVGTLQGNLETHRKAVIYNSAIRMWALGLVASVDAGVIMAGKLLDSGDAWRAYCTIRTKREP